MVFEKFKKALKEFIGADKQRETSVAHQYVQWDEEGGMRIDSRIVNTIGTRRQLESAAMLANLQRQEEPSPVLKGNAMRLYRQRDQKEPPQDPKKNLKR